MAYDPPTEPLRFTTSCTTGRAELSDGVGVAPSREISIKSLNYGYLVRVGCQQVAVEDYKTLIKNLESYLKDPSKFEENWGKKKELL